VQDNSIVQTAGDVTVNAVRTLGAVTRKHTAALKHAWFGPSHGAQLRDDQPHDAPLVCICIARKSWKLSPIRF